MKFQSKTLFVITKSNWGGAQKYVYDQAVELKENGAEVVVATGGSGELCSKLELADIEVVKISGLERNISLLRDSLTFFRLFKIYAKQKPTVIHLNSSKIGGLGSLAGRFYNTWRFLTFRKCARIIFTAHGWAFNEDRSALSKIAIKILSYITILLSHEVKVLSKFEAKQVQPFFLKPLIKNKIKITPLTLRHIEFIPSENARDYFGKNLSINEEIKWIGTIAELQKNKGLEYGIEAFTQLKKKTDQKILWIIIGDGEEKAHLQKIIDKQGLNDEIILFGYLKDAPKYIKAFDLFMLPSIKEGLPYVLLEARAAQIPIVATKVGGIEEYFGHEPNKIVEPKNPQALCKSLEEMLK
jgi:glycosyltransferase involved in cell wall biosynthesis